MTNELIIKADRIITGDGRTVLDAAVYIADGKIAELGELAVLQAAHPAAALKEYPGGTILPGLIDMHVHVGYWFSKSDAADYNDFLIALMAADYCKTAFSKGVTTMRDVSSVKNLCATLNKARKRGFIEIPRLIFVDAALCFTGGHGWELKDAVIEVNGPWEVRAAIRDNIKRGAQWLKVMSSHRSHIPEFTQEELDAAVDEAHRVGKKLAVHAGTRPAIQMCIDAGFDTIEHGTYLTVEQAQQMAKNGQVWCPTIAAYTMSYEVLLGMMEQEGMTNRVSQLFVEHHDYFRDAAMAYKQNFYDLYKTGVKIVVGTDLVYENAPVTAVAAEMKYMAEYGMPLLEVIQAATKNAAEVLGINTGEIAVGKEADVLVVAGNPAADIAALTNVVEVFYGGKSVYAKSG